MAVNLRRSVEPKLKSKLTIDIPFDITREILLRLSVRSLVRFRRVCKLWCSIIRDPQFIDIHLKRSRNTGLLSIFKSYGTMDVVNITRLDVDKHLATSVVEAYFSIPEDSRVTGSCNGLLCVVRMGDKSVRVLNPSTGESLTVPGRTQSFYSRFVYVGFNPMTKEYKLVNFFGDTDIRDAKGMWVRCEVYTFGTSSWRDVGRFDYIPSGYVLVSAKGFMYWNIAVGVRLVRFDLKSDEFDQMSTINFDQFYVKKSRYVLGGRLVELQGSVGIPVYPCSKTHEISRMDLWLFNEDEHLWARKYSVIYPWRFDSLPTTLLINQDKILLWPNYSRASLQYHHLSRGDEEQGNDDQRSIEEVNFDQYCGFRTLVHIESLVPLPNAPTQASTTDQAAPSPVGPPTIRRCNNFESF